ncbi:carbohydrate kinase family protein [Salegentibacter mishustinae]|uniref:Carbohydrate kinase n=1 Tax=Salegentibacter mishustinae TaxID=270918 RepID=A0A0Q9ZHN5_9FLAO|nr:carbohydrate kinase [Salegentibacter mishustinae]KRG28263.1 carbohydrate kinase [Salegentibacter mishustinae]PNW22198.1 carbohydrate kinase [Salegentibacter mishustinae]PZX67417.1 fructokinase [Salegentibacter mishustinae]GGW79888.1 fructokinase [Salegentibacter mishustinae]
MSNYPQAICFGEILYDVFPESERIGGAPLNVASRLSGLGISTEMISKVGDDEKGENLLSYLKSKNIKTENIAKDTDHSTGVVNVTLSAGGSATYEISHPVAWDKIEISEAIKTAVKKADAFIFGSLVCRDEVSRNTLFNLLPEAKYCVFDINLRPPFYEKEVLVKLLSQADFIKFNDDELFEIAEMIGSPYNSLEQNLQYLSEETNTPTICVTKGRHGAVLLKGGKRFYNSGFKVKVKDTVGAGDSFLASLIAGLLKEEDPQSTLDFACAMGALVAGEEGANPEIKIDKINKFLKGK